MNKVNEHCRQKHNIRDADWVTAFRSAENIGKVEMSLRACNVLENTSKIPIWFGPALFKYDGVTFYQIVYKKPDVERRPEVILFLIRAFFLEPFVTPLRTVIGGWKNSIFPHLVFQPIVFFSIQALLPKEEARKYQYEVHLDMPSNQKPMRAYKGNVQSLELNINELLRNHTRNIVYFSQSYLCKTLSYPNSIPFNHNSNLQSSTSKMDITYTIKIMRQSL